MRDVLAHVPKTAQGMVAAFARTIWAQPDAASAHAQLGRIAEHLGSSFPKAAQTLLAAEEDVLAYTAVPSRGDLEAPRRVSLISPGELPADEDQPPPPPWRFARRRSASSSDA